MHPTRFGVGVWLALVTLTLVPAAAEAAPGTLTKASRGYRWSREDLTVSLRDRSKRWSEAEAQAVAAALDKLPDALLRKALVEMRVRTWYRDPLPVGRGGEKKPDASATTVIEGGYVSYGDNLFEGMKLGRIYATVTHELGHCAQYAVIGGSPRLSRARAVTLGTPGWSRISWTSVITRGRKSWNGFVSDYARRKNDREDFAESVEFYWLAPAELLRTHPRKYVFMRDEVFGGAVSPASARKENHRAIAPVKPEISRLGDREDDALSLVKVRGKYFMGPLDGGYNRVRYRGKRALHLAVSRSTLWSWVPAMGTGSAPITVTTQDGTSDPASFRVTKPWWKFW